MNDLGSLFATPPSLVLLTPPEGELVTVVGGLDDDGRRRLLDALRALPAGTDPGWDGLVEAHGVVLDLHRDNLRLLGMGHTVDVVVGPRIEKVLCHGNR